MKTVTAFVVALLCGSSLWAAEHGQDAVVSWHGLAGVITGPGLDNPVAVITNHNDAVVSQIHSGTLPWVARSGDAHVDLNTGAASFTVRGLVLNGGNASGTAGPINQVVGTLVCNPGNADYMQPQAVVDTPPVTLSSRGDADFSGELTLPVRLPCANPLFLIRIGPAFGAFAGRWLATALEPHFD
jgi:hypothetical protein